jgi:Neuraminidase (sialidase)
MIYSAGGNRFRGSNANESGQLRAAVSRDGGATWHDDRQIEVHPDPQVTHGRPTALIDSRGTIHVFYFGFVRFTGDRQTSQSDMWTIRSEDGGKTWGHRQRIWQGYTGMTEPAIETRKQRLLMPLSYFVEAGRFAACVVRSDDRGRTWTSTDGIELPTAADAEPRKRRLNGGALEPTIVELSDGRILMLLRTITGRFWQCESSDGGETWSSPRASALRCGGPGTLRRLDDGSLLLIYNPADNEQTERRGYPHGFGSQAIAISRDDGRTWSPPVEFAKAARTVHSVSVERSPGELLLTLPEFPLLLQHALPQSDRPKH